MKEIIFCVIGAFAFSIIMKAPKKCLISILFGGIISAGVYQILFESYGELLSCMIAMMCTVFYSEIMARVLKEPSTVILMPSTIPLLPGSSIYYTMLYGVLSDSDGFLRYGKATLFAGLGIALGAVISSIIVNIISKYKVSKINNNDNQT
ncbi:MAG: threonine/serine exporter family protein [Eubacterium sp.]